MTLEPWVTRQLGISLLVTPEDKRLYDATGTVELALRRNPARVQLLVSRVLGKHTPTPVGDVLAATEALGSLVRAACAGATPVVVGFAETATALGHAVAAVAAGDGGGAPYLHTTRRAVPPGAVEVAFREEHSHAAEHTLAVLDETVGDMLLRTDVPLVLVDDELSTGRTAVNAIRALHRRWPRAEYVLASLLDCRDDTRRADTAAAVAALGARLTSVTLATGVVVIPDDALERAAGLRATLPSTRPASPPPHPPINPALVAETRRWSRTDGWGEADFDGVTAHELVLSSGVPLSGASGWSPAHDAVARHAATTLALSLPVHRDARTLVLGDEEHMYVPQLLASALGPRVHTSSTTRSPAVVVDAPGYPLRTVLSFGATEDATRAAFAYNVAPSAASDTGNAPGFDDIVFVTDVPAVASGDLVARLTTAARRAVHVVTVRAC